MKASRLGVCVGLLSIAAVAGQARGQAVLDKYDATLTVNKMSAATGLQGVLPLHNQRGVGMDGSSRGGGVFGWSLAGNGVGGGLTSSMVRLGPVDLATDAYSVQEVDLALPAAGSGRWTIGRSFNGRQNNGSHVDSNGPQGYNWFQSSQPELSVYVDGSNHANDVAYLVYAADRYIEFQRTTSTSNVYKAKNGAAGVIEYKSGSPDTWEYTDQSGIVTTFWGGNTASGKADWQVWKIADPAGNTAYVGDASVVATAISGYNSDKTIGVAYDAAGRRYTYSYSTVGGVSRLTQVKAEIQNAGSWASPTMVGQVDYTYYTSDEAGRGKTGDLKMVAVTTPQSSGVDIVKKKHYRYYDDAWANSDGRRGDVHQLKLVVGFEGCRNFDWAGDATFDEDFLTASDADLLSYSEAWFEYENNAKRRITKAFFNGECGCSGGNNGTFTIVAGDSASLSTYVGNGSYDNVFATRTVVTRPDSTWATYYFDETGQPLNTLITNTDPSGSPSQSWSTSVARDSSTGVVSRISTPANNSAFSYSAGTATETASGGSAAMVTPQGVSATTNLVGLPTSSKWATGTSGSAYLRSSRVLGSVSKTIGSGTTVDIVRPTVTESWVYTEDTTTEASGTGPSGAYKTAISYTYWSGADLTPKVVTVTAPAASTSKNGSGASAVSTRYLRKDGTSAFVLGPDGNYTYSQYTNGQLTTQKRDVKTNGSFTSGDDPNTDFGITETGNGDELVSTYAYDAQGRMTEMVPPDWQGASGSPTQVTYFTKLADGRQVVLSVPRRTVSGGTTTYMGPVGYSVMNHAGQVEFSATLVLSGGSTTTAISSWIDTSDSDPIQAVSLGGATLFKIATTILSNDGRRVNATRTYFLNYASLPGTLGTHYDEQTFGYDDMGRRWRTKDATGTITRTVFDTLGRVTETWIGTNDHSFSGGESSGTDNMTKTEVREYDGGSAGKNSLLTKVTRDPDGDWDNTGTGGHPADDRRITQYTYDARDRLVLTTNPQAPHGVVKYDAAGRVVASGGYSSASGLSATTDPTSTTTNRVALSETAYDEAGRAYRSTQHKINLSTGASDDTLVSDTWRDEVGRVLKTRGTSISKTFYDRQSRPYRQFTLAKLNDNAGTGSESDTDVAQAGTVTGDLVLEERQTVYDTQSGRELFSVNLQRLHNDTTTGALDGNADADIATLTVANGGSNVDYNKVRVAGITATWYDELHRPTATASYGTNSSTAGAAGNGATFTRPGSAPSTSSSVLVSTTTYAADGTVLESTDPRGIKSRTVHDDAGRTTKTIRNYVDGTAGGGTNADEDQIIEYGYTNGLQTTYVARVPGGTDQTTTYIFGSTKGTSAGQSAIATGSLLRATKFPDSSNGGTTLANIDSDSSDVVSVAYNSLGQEIYRKDQVGSVIQTDYDTAGRTTYRRVTTLGSGVNGDVRRVGMGYTSGRGQLETVTQYDNATVGSGAVTDEVKYVYDDWGNLTNFRQDRDSAVSSSGGANGYQEVAYAFSKASPTYGAVAVRPTTITLPGSFDVTLDYGTANGLNDCVSRVDAVKFSGTSIATYQYLGMGTLVSTELGEPDAASRLYNSSTPASYEALDQFGRVVISRWQNTGGSGREFYHVGLEYDYDSNITAATDTVNAGYDAKYTMDGLNRLIVADEGTLSGGSITSRTRKETWTLNQVGDWGTFTSDLDGNGTLSSPAFGPTDEKNETRTFNTANEITARTNNGVTKNPAYNANGQQTDDGVNHAYEWDAFGRLTKVSTRGGSPATVVQYKYNGLNYMIGRHGDLNASGSVTTSDMWEWAVYDPKWRRVATYMVAGTDFSDTADSSPKERYVHHAAGRFGNGSYIDSVILRDRDQTAGNNGSADGTLENREYYCQNWRADVSVTMTGTGRILEWLKYSAYGVCQRIAAADFNRDNFVDFFDDGDFATAYGGSSVTADINFDGATNFTDDSQWSTTYAEQGATARGELSQDSGVPAHNRLGYAGYFFEPATSQYAVRNRNYASDCGDWKNRDAIGYVDGASLYGYVAETPIRMIDPLGLAANDCAGGRDPVPALWRGPVDPPCRGISYDWNIEAKSKLTNTGWTSVDIWASTVRMGGQIDAIDGTVIFGPFKVVAATIHFSISLGVFRVVENRTVSWSEDYVQQTSATVTCQRNAAGVFTPIWYARRALGGIFPGRSGGARYDQTEIEWEADGEASSMPENSLKVKGYVLETWTAAYSISIVNTSSLSANVPIGAGDIGGSRGNEVGSSVSGGVYRLRVPFQFQYVCTCPEAVEQVTYAHTLIPPPAYWWWYERAIRR